MIFVLILSIIMSGWASQYDPGVMERVIPVRQRMHQLQEDIPDIYDGYIAVQDFEDVGRSFWIKPQTSNTWELFLAVDCASRSGGSHSWMVRNNILVEVDGKTARRWSTVGRGIKVEMFECMTCESMKFEREDEESSQK